MTVGKKDDEVELAIVQPGTGSEVADLQRAVPPAVEIVTNEAPVAMMRRILGAEKAAILKHVGFEPVLDLALLHKAHERMFVDTPIALITFERLQNVVGWRKNRLMRILRPADLFQEESKIICFGESR